MSPAPGQLAGLVDTVTVDLADQYTGVLVIDGRRDPGRPARTGHRLETISFRPGPDKEISRFRAGENTVVVKYWEGRLKDRPATDPSSFSWNFRAAA